ncbi:hypothetical protein NPIL_356211 [Nephila pilipes]|uniref:Uncharacterized protein n=1 Tax=Nephila pilipes TaxID=299642 RepID=A0A8X6QPM4_NEPPI|nr:hypothetical protein NPIL_356211 [Nephila pilipes]
MTTLLPWVIKDDTQISDVIIEGFHAQLSARIAVDSAETKRTSSAFRPPVTSPSPRPAAVKKIASCAPPQTHRLAPQHTPPPAQGDTGQRPSGLAPDKSTLKTPPPFGKWFYSDR